ncbi:methyl-accepting chemotaxis protein [Aquibacillus sp. LR5S19]|uniref:Methyl-accepting chemotaxis protein n=1 Tax=Aquibacillus rhizosphaerae TaxID=3051431 RepID=A0ABT7LBC2_9BACI|nr:methyl-accepting chemotaxis protein [Aquibacillus sp. LR5S19]MDL4841855.1 methyl-accepting chemotaxis protein [Aquibacillus sp. LR5S19]
MKKLKLKKLKNLNINDLKMNNLSIGKKYGVTLLIVFILFGISTAVVSKLIVDVGHGIENMENGGDNAVKVTEMGSLLQSKGNKVFSFSKDRLSRLVGEYEEDEAKFDQLVTEVEEDMNTEELKSLFEQIVEIDNQLNELFLQDMVEADDKGDLGDLAVGALKANKAQTEAVALLNELRTLVLQQRTASINEAEENQKFTLVILLVSMVISIIIGGLLVYLISRKVSKNLKEVVLVSNQIAVGNLAVNKINYDSKDEIGQIAFAMNKMTESLRSMIQNISAISDTVSSQSEELTQSANEVKLGSDQVASTMQELASGAESQANSAGELSEIMGTFADDVSDANDNGEQVYHSSNQVLGMTKQGSQLMETSISQMNKVDQIVKTAVEKVQGLDTKSQEISKLVSVIKDIADQTNLLALNAAIEAARAGEHGKGFAVVADEVRKLAEQVSLSVTDITTIVGNIKSESSLVTESLKDGYKEVEEGTSQIQSTGETFAEINSSVKDMADKIQTITGKLSTITSSSQEMNASIQEIASISEESAAGVEETSAASEQTSRSMQEVADNSSELSKLAEDLNELIKRFKL